MALQANPVSVPFFLASAISSALAVFIWRQRATPLGRAFALMMAGEAGWALFEALELVVADIETKKTCFALRATGTVTMISSLLATVLHYTGRTHWVRPGRFAVICAPSVFLLAAAWTNPWHHLYWTRLWNAQIHGYWIAMPVYGPLFQAHFVYCYSLVAVSAFLLAEAVYRLSGVFRAQAAIMLFGVVFPWVVNLIDMSHLLGFIYVDSAAMGFAVTGLAFVPGLFRYRLLDLTPVAWAAVVARLDDAVIVSDRSGRIVSLNPAAQRLIGRSSADAIGAPVADAFARWRVLAEQWDGITVRHPAGFELDGPETAPPSCFDARISPLGDALEPSGWVVVLRDITLQKQAAQERVRMLEEQSARARAEAANLAKDRFLATLSHELRTPLTPILATVTAMLAEPDNHDASRSVLEMIQRNVLLEVRLIDDLLDLTRIRRGSFHLERELVDAHQLIRNVIDICRTELRNAGLSLDVDLPARRHHVNADPIRFQQALWNLVKNAIKFTPAGGKLTVRSRNGSQSTDAPGAPDLIIEVRDTGIGIAPDRLPSIFVTLEQGRSASNRRLGGLGLGLTISRSIVEQHDGRLSARSRGSGHGATFTIEIPTAPRPADRRDDDSPAVAPSSGGETASAPMRILLVDDDRDTRTYLSELLSRRGHHVHEARDLTSALQVVSQAELDVIVSDIELPDGSGLELLRALRQTNCALPAIALSGFGTPADIEQGLSAGFSNYLTKPVDFRRLEEAIRVCAESAATNVNLR